MSPLPDPLASLDSSDLDVPLNGGHQDDDDPAAGLEREDATAPPERGASGDAAASSALSSAQELLLVERSRNGEPEAFSELVNHYERRIFRLAKRITQNDEDAEDVLQESFLKAYQNLDHFQGNSKFYTWLVRIAVNEALMKLRKRKTDRTVPLDEPMDTGEETVQREIAVWEGNPEQRYSQEELHGILEEAIDSLKPVYRTVFVLRDVEEMSTEETAEALNLSIPAVKSRLLRARLQLREKLTRMFRKKGEDLLAYL
jgi:RNA polymerase sigma-70 factor, ECF subfamily